MVTVSRIRIFIVLGIQEVVIFLFLCLVTLQIVILIIMHTHNTYCLARVQFVLFWDCLGQFLEEFSLRLIKLEIEVPFNKILLINHLRDWIKI
jgi:hypothetical protein